jgi:hypothetical protein
MGPYSFITEDSAVLLRDGESYHGALHVNVITECVERGCPDVRAAHCHFKGEDTYTVASVVGLV